MKCHDKRRLVDRPTRAVNCLGHASMFIASIEVYNEPISTLFNVTEPDKGASSAHYAVLKPLCAGGVLDSFYKTAKMKNTGSRFRSYVLGVMSPARFLCAMPVSTTHRYRSYACLLMRKR